MEYYDVSYQLPTGTIGTHMYVPGTSPSAAGSQTCTEISSNSGYLLKAVIILDIVKSTIEYTPPQS